jgi:hypothetical protein
MNHRRWLVVALCCAAVLAPVSARADDHGSRLFPNLQVEDFPREGNTVRLEVPSLPQCGELRSDERASGTPIYVADSITYGDDDEVADRIPCTTPYDPGIYLLRYELDPGHVWDEGTAGESNNKGYARGFFYVPH